MPWKLTTEFSIDAAHTIVGYDGPCGRLHGHTYRVRVELQSEQLRPSAHIKRSIMVTDFKTLKWAKKDMQAGGLDHSNLNDFPDLGDDTTVEVLAAFLYKKTLHRVRSELEVGDSGDDLRLKITVWETSDSWCEYWEQK
jgi:6-pyruvoyltetrahydropterin/6-carboxytetrahydropterin synthase